MPWTDEKQSSTRLSGEVFVVRRNCPNTVFEFWKTVKYLFRVCYLGDPFVIPRKQK